MLKIYTDKQLERELDRRICEINRLDHIERHMWELDDKIKRLENMMYTARPTCNTAVLKKCNED